MYSVNWRFLFGFVVALCLSSVGIHLLHGYQVRRNAKVFLLRASEARESGRMAEAIRNLTSYVQLEPDDIDARADLALLLADVGDLRRAYDTMEFVLRRDPQRAGVRRRLAQVSARIGRTADALAHLEPLLKETPEDAELLEWRGTWLLRQGKFRESAASFEAALAAQPDRLDCYLPLAALYRQRLEMPQSEAEVLERLVAHNDTSARAYRLRADYYRQVNRLDEALADAERAVELDAQNVEGLVLLAEVARAHNDHARAEEILRRAVELHPDVPQLYLQLAQLAGQKGKSEQAAAWVREGLERHPDNRELIWSMANQKIAERAPPAEIERLVERLRQLEQPPPTLELLAARRAYLDGQWYQCIKTLDACRAALDRWPELARQADTLRAQCFARLGNPDQQLEAYRRLVNDDPLNPSARLGLAHALAAMGRTQDAIAEYQQLVRLPSAPASALRELASLMVLDNLQREPARRDWPAVEQVLAMLADRLPDDSAAAILRVEVALGKGERESAERELAAATERFPDDETVWGAAFNFALQAGELEDAQRRLEQHRQQYGDTVTGRLAAMRLAVRQSPDTLGEQWDAWAAASERFSESDERRLLSELAVAAFQHDDYAHAQNLATRAAARAPGDVRLLRLRLEIALRQGDDQAMRGILDDIKRLEGTGPLWHFSRAAYLVIRAKKGELERLSDARVHLSHARRQRPNWSRIPALMAIVEELEGNQDAAIREYLRAIELGDRDPGIIRNVAQVLYQRGQYREADRLIRQLQQQQLAGAPELGRLASMISMELDEHRRALELAATVARDSTDVRDYVWLGYVLTVTERFEQAERAFRRATRLAPAEPAGWIALVQFYARTNRADDARKAIGEAQAAIDADKAPPALAKCYELVGDIDQAQEQIDRYLASHPEEPAAQRAACEFYLRNRQASRATPLLTKLAQNTSDASRADRAWARRALALLHAENGDYRSRLAARQMVEQNLAATPGSTEDRQALAYVLASLGGKAERARAIKILRELTGAAHAAALEERLLLAKLYLADDQYSAFVQQMRELLARSHDTSEFPRYVAYYARVLLDRSEISEAALWIDRLAELAPQSMDTYDLRARLLVASQPPRADDAIALLREAATTAGADWEVAVRVALRFETYAKQMRDAQLLEAATKFIGAADALYREWALENPEGQLALVGFLARQQKFDEAMAILERAWPAVPVERLLPALPAVVTAAGNDPGRQRTVDTLLQQLVEKYPEASGVLLTMATTCHTWQRYDDALAYYERVLAMAPDNIVALNNSAVILALQRRDLPTALRMINLALEIHGPSSELLDTRATVYLAMGKSAEAVRDMEQAVAQAGDDPLYLFRLTLAYQANQQFSEAVSTWGRAKERGLHADMIGPLERDAYDQLAQLFAS